MTMKECVKVFMEVLIITAGYSWISTAAHEWAHLVTIKLTKHRLNLWQLPNDSRIKYAIPFCGRTDSSIYQYLENNKTQSKICNYIRINAISGISLELTLYLYSQINLHIEIMQISLPKVTTGVILTKLVIFFYRSSDFKYFHKPETFEYKTTDSSCYLILLNSVIVLIAAAAISFIIVQIPYML